jgi:hypothetical protein
MRHFVGILGILVLGPLAVAGTATTKQTAETQSTGRFPAAAPKYPTYVEECRKPAGEKLKSIAQINGFELDEHSISVSSVDDRWYNPSKYIWFSATMRKADGRSEIIQVLTQKSFLPLKNCF